MGSTTQLPRGASYGGRTAADIFANNSRPRTPIRKGFAPSDAPRPGATLTPYVRGAILQDGGAAGGKPRDIDADPTSAGRISKTKVTFFLATHSKLLALPLPFPTRPRTRKSTVPFSRKMAPNEIEHLFARTVAISRVPDPAKHHPMRLREPVQTMMVPGR